MRNKSPIHKKTIPKSHSFGTNIILGALSGMAAYYVFGTKSGSKFRDQFAKEYQKNLKQINKHLQTINSSKENKSRQLHKTSRIKTKLAHTFPFLNQNQPDQNQDLVKNDRKSSSKESSPKKKFFTKSGRKLN